MKKIIVSIIVTLLLLNIVSLSIHGRETVYRTSFNLGNQIPNFSIGDVEDLNSNSSEILAGFDLPIEPEFPYFVPGELIVKFSKDTSICMTASSDGVINTGVESLDKLNREYMVTSAEELFGKNPDSELSQIYKLSISRDSDIFSAVEKYNSDLNVEFAEPNYICHLDAMSQPSQSTKIMSYPSNPVNTPNDPYFNQQWALHNIGQTGGKPDADIDAPEAWEIEEGSSNVKIAIIDSGVDYTHPDLANNIWINEDEINNNGKDDDNNGYVDDLIGWNFAYDNNNPMDDNGHGSHCAGIVAAVTNNSVGIAGVCWNCKIMILKSTDKEGVAYCTDLVKAIVYATENGADVISMSWGYPWGYPLLYYEKGLLLLSLVLSYANSKGIVLVAAAGNDNVDKSGLPATHDKVIAVAATDNNDSKVFFSNYGGWVDVAAPGLDILSTIPDEKYDKYSGTSMACPHVAGLVGLILSKNPSLKTQEVLTILRSSTDSVISNCYIGAGRINAFKALKKTAHVTAEIKSSFDNKQIKGKVAIWGIAYGDNFQNYVLEYGKGIYPDDNSWIQIKISSSPKYVLSVLDNWDTTNVADGFYTLRLKVTAGGYTYEDRAFILINNEINIFYVDDNNIDGPWDGSQEQPFNKIQDAIDNCGDEDTVYVYSGTYHECLQIDCKSISLIGQDKKTTIIENNIEYINNEYALMGTAVMIFASKGIELHGFTIINNFDSRYMSEPDIITLFFSSHCTISDNYLFSINSTGHGINLFESSNNKIIENNLDNSVENLYFSGVFMSGMIIVGVLSFNNYISDNTIEGYLYGICLIQNCFSNKIYNNIIKNALQNESSMGILIDSNPFENGNKPFNNDINDNIISTHAPYGIYLGKSKNNNIYNNSITNSTEYGIYATGESKNNHIYYNDFINNSINAYDKGSNTWYKFILFGKSMGNYWDDYTGSDNNGDGIGDTPYIIAGGSNKDRYPLMSPYNGSSQSTQQSEQQTQPSSQPSEQLDGTTQQSTAGSTTNN